MRRTLASIVERLRDLSIPQFALKREYERIKADIARRVPGCPATFGYKVYSQCDEDGIISRIFAVLGDGDRTFVEIGSSDGLENNTHALLLQGWQGAWFEADSHKVRFVMTHLPTSSRLVVKQSFVTTENVVALVKEALAILRAESVDFLSIDIDSDDLDVLMVLLDYAKPRVICAEYNAKFPPPIRMAIRSRPSASWAGDDYYGASLALLAHDLKGKGYRLIACNASGVNAFFVLESDASKFPAFSIEQLYQPAAHELRRLSSGHRPSLKFLADTLAVRSDE